MEAFILFCMIFGIMAPIFVPIAGGIVWGCFAAIKFLFWPFMFLGGLYLLFKHIVTHEESVGTLLHKRAQLEEERYQLLREKRDRLLREKEELKRPWPKTVRRNTNEI